MLAEMNVLHGKGQLTPAQAAFMSATKPPVELFDLRSDPHEVYNLADDTRYAQVKAELMAALDNWRQNVIHDQGVSPAFRAQGVFPDTCPNSTVAEWVNLNGTNYDFNTHGWPAWYPTRTLPEWEKARALWEPYVFRKPLAKVRRPVIPHTVKAK